MAITTGMVLPGDSFATVGLNTVIKTASATLLKTETMVLASNDITITLPAVTASDNGWEMTVKNVGLHTDLVSVVGTSGATIDEKVTQNLPVTRRILMLPMPETGN
jgi:hypothetical protein